MRRRLSLILVLALLLLSGCGAETMSVADPAEESGEGQSTLQFALGDPLVYENEYHADDGTLLLTVSYELPQLMLCTLDGETYEMAEVDTQTLSTQLREVSVRDRFNAEMTRELAARKESAKETLEMARSHYAMTEEENRVYWAGYTDGLRMETSYLSGDLLSVRCSAYSYSGGAHPNSGTYTWNYDLTSGEFFTLDSLDQLTSSMSALGETLTHTLALYILDEIDERALADGYYEDYYSYIFDLAANAAVSFTESGMTVVFDPYVIAPYAAGAQTFAIPYSAFYRALDAHTQSLLDVSREEIVLADYGCAEMLWSWFYLTTAPIDTGAAGVNVNGDSYFRIGFGGGEMNSLDALRALACAYVSGEVAEEWLATGRFLEANGALYTVPADRGSNMNIGEESFAVEWDGADGGTLVQTVRLQEFNSEGEMVKTGETEQYEYPFTFADGHAVFSAFPCPW